VSEDAGDFLFFRVMAQHQRKPSWSEKIQDAASSGWAYITTGKTPEKKPPLQDDNQPLPGNATPSPQKSTESGNAGVSTPSSDIITTFMTRTEKAEADAEKLRRDEEERIRNIQLKKDEENAKEAAKNAKYEEDRLIALRVLAEEKKKAQKQNRLNAAVSRGCLFKYQNDTPSMNKHPKDTCGFVPPLKAELKKFQGVPLCDTHMKEMRPRYKKEVEIAPQGKSTGRPAIQPTSCSFIIREAEPKWNVFAGDRCRSTRCKIWKGDGKLYCEIHYWYMFRKYALTHPYELHSTSATNLQMDIEKVQSRFSNTNLNDK